MPTTPTGQRVAEAIDGDYAIGEVPTVEVVDILAIEAEAKSMRDEEIKDALKRYYNDHYLTFAEYQAVSGLLKAMSEEARKPAALAAHDAMTKEQP